MKPLLTLAVLILGFVGNAQSTVTPSSGGFWVVESNVKTPKSATVYFYTNEQVLVYKETVTGRRLHLKKKKQIRHLNQVLDQSIAAWKKEQVLQQDLNLVRLKNK